MNSNNTSSSSKFNKQAEKLTRPKNGHKFHMQKNCWLITPVAHQCSNVDSAVTIPTNSTCLSILSTQQSTHPTFIMKLQFALFLAAISMPLASVAADGHVSAIDADTLALEDELITEEAALMAQLGINEAVITNAVDARHAGKTSKPAHTNKNDDDHVESKGNKKKPGAKSSKRGKSQDDAHSMSHSMSLHTSLSMEHNIPSKAGKAGLLLSKSKSGKAGHHGGKSSKKALDTSMSLHLSENLPEIITTVSATDAPEIIPATDAPEIIVPTEPSDSLGFETTPAPEGATEAPNKKVLNEEILSEEVAILKAGHGGADHAGHNAKMDMTDLKNHQAQGNSRPDALKSASGSLMVSVSVAAGCLVASAYALSL